MSKDINNKTKYGFYGCLEANAFEAILNRNDIPYRKEIMESMEEKGIDNPEVFEEVFTIDSDIALPTLALDVFDSAFGDFELYDIIEDNYVEVPSFAMA